MSDDSMPEGVATTLLLSGQKMTNSFRKVCQRARERILQPASACSVPPQSSLQRKLAEASAAQLHKWYRRALLLANRYQDQRDDISFDAGFSDDAKEILIGRLDPKLAEMNEICEATQTELDKRANRGKVNP